MDEKVIKLEITVDKYRKLAEKHAMEDDFLGALGFLFSAHKMEPDNLDVLSDIADIYTEMGLPELSNKYWFLYLDKAPKSKSSLAYEELAINYFYTDNLFASTYYFNLKIKQDGFISREKLGDELNEFFFETVDRKSLYHVAYPFDQADYSTRQKLAKKALSSGNYKVASAIYASIPAECRTEEINGEYAISNFLQQKDEEVIKIAKDSIARHGDNVTAYCNLCSVYGSKGDAEKSRYYYEKALSSRKGVASEAYQLGTCAIDLGDDETANECLKVILEDRPNDTVMGLFYAQSLINLNKYEQAVERLSELYRIDPTDSAIKFYLDFAKKLLADGNDNERLLPLEYKKGFPEKIERKYKRQIRKLLESPEEMTNKKSGLNENVEKLFWGIKYGDTQTGKKCVYLITLLGVPTLMDRLKDCLLDPDVSTETKGGAVYALVLNGCKQRFGVVAGNIYESVKPRKLLFEGTPAEMRFLPAYAMALARVLFSGVDDFEKVGVSASRIYKKYGDEVERLDLSIDELAALIVRKCNLKLVKNRQDIYKNFGVEKGRITVLESIINGESDDENN